VCDESWKKPLAISFQFYGIMCGCAMAGYLTDRYVQKNHGDKNKLVNDIFQTLAKQ